MSLRNGIAQSPENMSYDSILDAIAVIFEEVNYHFQIIFSIMCGLIAAAWVDLK